MPGFWIVVALVSTLFAAFFWGKRLYRNRKRKRIISLPFPETWEHMLRKNVFLYRKVPPSLNKRLKEIIKIFLAEKRFEGCNGLVITDEIRLTIAGQACLLLMNRPRDIYPELTSILVYPGAYKAQGRVHLQGNAYIEGLQVRAGESWTRGIVVLAWDHVKRDSMKEYGGRNVVLHEFAHQLDQESGKANGAPLFSDRSRYAAWSTVFRKTYRKLQSLSFQGEGKWLIDDYGALNPAEFFAVATETFFKNPQELKVQEFELYRELRRYYELDPAAWFENEKKGEHHQ